MCWGVREVREGVGRCVGGVGSVLGCEKIWGGVGDGEWKCVWGVGKCVWGVRRGVERVFGWGQRVLGWCWERRGEGEGKCWEKCGTIRENGEVQGEEWCHDLEPQLS